MAHFARRGDIDVWQGAIVQTHHRSALFAQEMRMPPGATIAVAFVKTKSPNAIRALNLMNDAAIAQRREDAIERYAIHALVSELLQDIGVSEWSCGDLEDGEDPHSLGGDAQSRGSQSGFKDIGHGDHRISSRAWLKASWRQGHCSPELGSKS